MISLEEKSRCQHIFNAGVEFFFGNNASGGRLYRFGHSEKQESVSWSAAWPMTEQRDRYDLCTPEMSPCVIVNTYLKFSVLNEWEVTNMLTLEHIR